MGDALLRKAASHGHAQVQVLVEETSANVEAELLALCGEIRQPNSAKSALLKRDKGQRTNLGHLKRG